MKNRLEIAHEFLRDDGVIFVQCDDNEQAYLKVLMDEIFGRENFSTIITCKVKAPSGVGIGREPFFDCAEYLLVYAKNKKKWNFNLIKTETSIVGEKYDKTKDNYNKFFKKINLKKKKKIKNSDNIFYLDDSDYEIASISAKDRTPNNYFINFDNVFRTAPSKENTIRETIASSKVKSNFFIIKKDDSYKFIYKNEDILMLKDYCKEDKNNKQIIKLDYITNIMTDDLWQGISSEGQIQFKNAKKPESLIKRIIEISTQPNDIVMDFFLGSGTTSAVAHKMNRQYIGIEQMDYIESVSVERLKKVIEGEQGGISKAINWQGGGEFIYFELAKFNQKFIDKISDAKVKDILNIYDEICEKAFLNYDADSKILKDKKDDFKEFNLAEQKEFLLNILNKNMLYVNLDDIEDENYEISQKDKELNKDFYNE